MQVLLFIIVVSSVIRIIRTADFVSDRTDDVKQGCLRALGLFANELIYHDQIKRRLLTSGNFNNTV